jgi:hypothetical protein
MEVVSAAVGTKSVPRSKLCPDGCVQGDCHAEVLARRGWQKAIMKDLNGARKWFE